MRLSLRNKFLIPMVLTVLIGMAISTVISYTRSRTALETAIDGQIAQLAGSASQAVAAWVRDRRLDVSNWSGQQVFQTALKDSFVGKAARKSAGTMLNKMKEDYQYYENICLANTAGEIVAAADDALVGKVNIKDRDYFQTSLQGELTTSPVLVSRASGNPVFTIAHPIKARDQIIGVLFSVLDMTVFSRLFVDPIKVGSTGYAYVMNAEGMVLAHPDKSHILKTNLKQYSFGEEIMAAGDGMITYTFEGLRKKAAFQTEKLTGWVVCVTAGTKELLAPVNQLGFVNLIVAAVVVLVAALIVLLLVRSIVNPLLRIVEGLTAGTDQVAGASGQVATASQTLAGGASDQAASIEETSSSLEEMSSMTRQNAENATQADSLMKQANQVVENASGSMNDMTRSMDEISQASTETSKIIKTIDEIAFQTNLLALNAAVEAARAGEAGAGFAVVADEVRNLAMRAAEAAQNTSALIEGTLQKVQGGTELVAKASDGFAEVATSSSKVGELVAEIAVASEEQARGIDQVARAVTAMDKVTQQNAATAEESASASEEMSAQTEQMRGIVGDLMVLVSGSKKDNDSHTSQSDMEGSDPNRPDPTDGAVHRPLLME